jgi:hypothetical protein
MHHLGKISYLPLLVIVLGLLGCNVINPAEELPAYVSMQNPKVVLNEMTGFSTNAGIRNIWLYHGGFLQGAYQIDPSLTAGRVVPVLQLERADFFMDAGIYETGQSGFQITYPFWDRVSFNWQATPGDTILLTPLFHYIDPTLYVLTVDEHFDGGSIDFVPFGSGLNADAASLRTQTTDVFQGTASGEVLFSQGKRWFESINFTEFYTEQSKNIFAEITYKSNIPFSVGLVYESSTGSVASTQIVTVSPSGTWNTIFVHMITEVRKIINAEGLGTKFWLWLKADGEDHDGYIRFDDIRVIREK